MRYCCLADGIALKVLYRDTEADAAFAKPKSWGRATARPTPESYPFRVLRFFPWLTSSHHEMGSGAKKIGKQYNEPHSSDGLVGISKDSYLLIHPYEIARNPL